MMGNLLTVLGLLVFALICCQSCGENTSQGYLASHSDELVILIVPNDASKVIKSEIQHTLWSDALHWEFDLDQEPQQYVEWLTDRLSGDFRMVRSSGHSLMFAKGIDGDTESIAVRINSGHQTLHVRVDVKVVAD